VLVTQIANPDLGAAEECVLCAGELVESDADKTTALSLQYLAAAFDSLADFETLDVMWGGQAITVRSVGSTEDGAAGVVMISRIWKPDTAAAVNGGAANG